MKRRSFISSSFLGLTSATIASCTGITSKEEAISTSHGPFRIPDLAPKPPLGWNSFDSYGVYLHHDAAMKNLKAMADKLKPHGYEYFVIDGGWYGEFPLLEGTLFAREKHAKVVNMNEFGIYQPSKTYFPQGFKPIVDYAHELGLKMGIHIMRGISRKAVEQNLPVKNSKYRAQDIADVNSICAWNDQNYGIDMSKPGAQDYYNSVFAEVAGWGFDFVKVDDLNPYPREIVAIAEAIENCGRKMVYSLSPGDTVYVPDMPYYRRANMMRITRDIWDRREDLDKAFEAWKVIQGYASPGFWPDMDMIPFGQLQLMDPEEHSTGVKSPDLAGLGHTRQSNLTPAQMRTFITMRSLAASPLMMGGDLPSLDDYSLGLITDKEMLACNQNGVCAVNVHEKDAIEVWMVQEKDKPGMGWIGIFNRSQQSKTVDLSRRDFGLLKFTHTYVLQERENDFEFFDVWKEKGEVFNGERFTAEIEGDDVVFIRFKEVFKVG